MKPKTSLLLTVTLAFCLVAVPVSLTTGCQTSSSTKTQTYKTIKTVADSVNIAMKGYADASVAGLVDSGTQTKVRELHLRYQQSLQLAVDAARYDYSQVAPAELVSLATRLTALIVEVTKKH